MFESKTEKRLSFGPLTLRYVFFAFVALMIGVAAAEFFITEKEWITYTVFGILSAFAVLAFILGGLKARSVALVCLIACLTGFCAFFIQKNFIESQQTGYRKVYLTGYTSELTEVSGTRLHGYLRDCTVEFGDGSRLALRGQVSVDYYGVSENMSMGPGYKISFECMIADVFVYRDGIDTYAFRNDCFYNIEEITGEIKIEEGKPELNEVIRGYISDRYELYLSEDNYGVAMAIVLGDRSTLSGELNESYRKSGLAHLFSVSGLHVGFISVTISWVLKKLRLKRIATFIIVTAAMTGYGWICNFPSSVIRAILMSSLGILVKYREPDMLTNISFAGLVMVLADPVVMFDGGFQMSFAAVAGMATIGNYLNAMYLRRRKTGKAAGVVSAASACIGATLGTMPFVMIYYGEISLISLFCNMITVSLMSVIFVMLILFLLPFFGPFLIIPDMILIVINKVLAFASSWSMATIESGTMGITAIIYFLLILVIVGEIGVKGRRKRIMAAVMSVAVVVGLIFSWLPESFENKVVASEYGYTLFISEEGGAVVFSELKNSHASYKIVDELKKYGNTEYDLVITDISATSPDALSVLIKNENAALRSVYIPETEKEEYEAYYLAVSAGILSEKPPSSRGINVISEYYFTHSSLNIGVYIGTRVYFCGREYLIPSDRSEYADEFLSRVMRPIGFIAVKPRLTELYSGKNVAQVVTEGFGYAENIYSCSMEGDYEVYPGRAG